MSRKTTPAMRFRQQLAATASKGATEAVIDCRLQKDWNATAHRGAPQRADR